MKTKKLLTAAGTRVYWIRFGAFGLLSLSSLSAAPEGAVWTLDRTDRIGGAAAEVIGAPTILAGAAVAVIFNGTSDGLVLPVNPLAGFQAFTVEILVRPDPGGGEEQRFFHAEDKAQSRALMELRVLPGDNWCLDSYLRAGKSSRALLDRSKAHPAGKWCWVAMSYDGKTMASFVNGVRELEGEITFPLMTEGLVSLGVRQNKVSWFKGAIREVRFHPVALSADKLQSALPAQ